MRQTLINIYLIVTAFAVVFTLLAFIEMTKHIAFGCFILLLFVAAVFLVADSLSGAEAKDKLIDVYRKSESVYKDSLKVERDHYKQISEVVDKSLKISESVNDQQIEMHGMIKDYFNLSRELIRAETNKSKPKKIYSPKRRLP